MNKRGGKREGAGRKPSEEPNKERATFWLSPEVLEYLRQCETQGPTVEKAIKGTKSFRAWKQSR